MSSGSPKLARREKAIEAARRRLRLLEIEAHRIKADLARLEADYEDDVADLLSRKLRRRATSPAPLRVDAPDVSTPHVITSYVNTSQVPTPHLNAPQLNAPNLAEQVVLPFNAAPRIGPAPTRQQVSSVADHKANGDLPKVSGEATNVRPPVRVVTHSGPAATYRKSAPPIVVSFAIHALMLCVGASITIVTLVQQQVPLFASPTDFNDVVAEEISEIEIEPSKFDDAELQNVMSESLDFNVTDNLLRDVEPAELGAGTQALGDIGQLDALPGDLGTLMAGAGSPGSGQAGGPLGSAIFFGARSKGDRFVFVVDNSSSMKGGRLEMATAELLRTVDELSPKQGFYVIFVSDETYPMFYPVPAPDLVPATDENKKRLAQWLPNAILASGDNRELIKAMDMAAALRPQAVFLLWDGDMKYSDKVRMEVMTHLTRPGQWNFTIHTLGMGVTSLDAEQNLAAIAQAHNGTYRRVAVPGVRGR